MLFLEKNIDVEIDVILLVVWGKRGRGRGEGGLRFEGEIGF